MDYFSQEALINCLRKRSAALGGAQKLVYPIDMSRFLRSIRLASHLVQRINQYFPNQIHHIFPLTSKIYSVNFHMVSCLYDRVKKACLQDRE